MSSIALWRRPDSAKPRRGAESERRSDLRWGVAGLCCVLLLVVVIGVVYVKGTTPERTYSAEMTQTGGLRPGDDVRVAGIPVGTVKSLKLLPDRVRMTFTVSSAVFVGDLSTLDIRMLTIVGGYYVSVAPVGAKPLGSTVIPQDRVTIPYNLMQAFQDAVQPVQQIDGTTLRQDLAALASAINGSPDAAHSAVRAVGDLVGIMDRQNTDVSQTLSLADEYLAALNANSSVLRQLLTTLNTLEFLVERDKEIERQALDDLGTVLNDFSPLGRAWDESLKQRVQPLADAMPKLQELATGLGSLLDSLRTLAQRLTAYLPPEGGVSVDQSQATIQASALCVPIPGGGC